MGEEKGEVVREKTHSSCGKKRWQSGPGDGSTGRPCVPSSPLDHSPRSSESCNTEMPHLKTISLEYTCNSVTTEAFLLLSLVNVKQPLL